MEQVTITAKLEGRTRFDETTKNFVCLCPRLKVYSQGSTKEEAESALRESVLQYLEVCLTHGTLDDVMLKVGFTKTSSEKVKEFKEFVRIEKTEYESVFDMEIPLCMVANEAVNACGDHPSTARV